MSVEQNKAIIQRVVDAVNQRDFAVVDELFAADFVDHGRPGLSPGPEALEQFYAMACAALPDLAVTVEDVIAEGDRIAVRGFWRGTQQGELMGIPATGREALVSFSDINRIVDGKIVERWAVEDTLGMLRQLGIIPAAQE